MDHARALGDAGNTNGYPVHVKAGGGKLGARIGGHDGAGHLFQVRCGGPQPGVQCRQRGGQLIDGQGYADDAGGRGEDGMWFTAEDGGGAHAALLCGGDAGLAGGAIGIAGIDQHHAELMLTAMQVALADDQRRGDDFVAGEHGGSGGRPVGHRAGQIGVAAGFEACAHGSKREAARNLILANERCVSSGRRVGHAAFTLSRESSERRMTNAA
jgi:hypothetical protein